MAAQFGPTANFNTTRNWTDANANFHPDCDLQNPAQQDLRSRGGDLCGPYNNPSVATFSENTTVENPEFTQGWFKRGYNWRATAGIEQQLMNRLAVSVSYARTIKAMLDAGLVDHLLISSDYIGRINTAVGEVAGQSPPLSRLCSEKRLISNFRRHPLAAAYCGPVRAASSFLAPERIPYIPTFPSWHAYSRSGSSVRLK